jgi:propionyl-CoA carboxylase alpha chain
VQDCASSEASLTSQMPGTVLKLLITPGTHVARGTPLLILEAMKMEHEVVAPHAGAVRAVPVEPGQQVDAGAVLIILEEDAP